MNQASFEGVQRGPEREAGRGLDDLLNDAIKDGRTAERRRITGELRS
jgi:hypothetical protein